MTISSIFSLTLSSVFSWRSRREADKPLCPRLQLRNLQNLPPIWSSFFVTFLIKSLPSNLNPVNKYWNISSYKKLFSTKSYFASLLFLFQWTREGFIEIRNKVEFSTFGYRLVVYKGRLKKRDFLDTRPFFCNFC